MKNVKLKIKKGDNVIVIAGDDKNKTGIVKSVDPKTQRVIVEGLNMVKKHMKPNATNPDGGIVEIESSMHISNIAIVDGDKPTKVGRRVEDGKIVRYMKSNDKTI